jgi:hypothetical protein
VVSLGVYIVFGDVAVAVSDHVADDVLEDAAIRPSAA